MAGIGRRKEQVCASFLSRYNLCGRSRSCVDTEREALLTSHAEARQGHRPKQCQLAGSGSFAPVSYNFEYPQHASQSHKRHTLSSWPTLLALLCLKNHFAAYFISVYYVCIYICTEHIIVTLQLQPIGTQFVCGYPDTHAALDVQRMRL